MNLAKRLLVAACAFFLAGSAALAADREPPVPVRTVAPDYPRDLREQKVSGVVMVKCTIDEQGNVAETEVAKSSNAGFDKFAVDALKKWKFKPARQDGAPVAMTVTIPIKFVVEES
jgi:TonB family C-terminal domain